MLDVLSELGLKGNLVSGLTGVWCKGMKVASIGVGCRRWITQHGIALNVNCDLKGFEQIIPCGLTGHKIGRIDSLIPGLSVQDVQPVMRRSLCRLFGLKIDEESP